MRFLLFSPQFGAKEERKRHVIAGGKERKSFGRVTVGNQNKSPKSCGVGLGKTVLEATDLVTFSKSNLKPIDQIGATTSDENAFRWGS